MKDIQIIIVQFIVYRLFCAPKAKIRLIWMKPMATKRAYDRLLLLI